MTQYNTLNVKLSNLQLNKLKSGIKKGTEVTLNLSSNLIENSNYETNFPHKLLLTNKQASKICKVFANSSSANINFSKTQLSKIQSGGFNNLNLTGPADVVYKIANKAKDLSNKVSLDDVIKIADISRIFLPGPKKHLSDPIKKLGIEKTPTNNEIKDIMNVIRSLENRGILPKGTTRKNTSKKISQFS